MKPGIAQLVERWTVAGYWYPLVAGSTPAARISNFFSFLVFCFFFVSFCPCFLLFLKGSYSVVVSSGGSDPPNLGSTPGTTYAFFLFLYASLFFLHPVQKKRKKKKGSVRRPGIEPGSTAWRATMLTITCLDTFAQHTKLRLNSLVAEQPLRKR